MTTRILRLLPLALLAACGDAKDIAEACGQQECPVGTAFSEYRSVREGFDLDADIDPLEYAGEVAFSTFGEGECRYTCETINACPEDTFPVITADCFTCGAITAEGEVAQGSCE